MLIHICRLSSFAFMRYICTRFFYLLALWWRLLASCSSSLDLFCPDPVTKDKVDEDGELVVCVETALVYRLLRISFCAFSLSVVCKDPGMSYDCGPGPDVDSDVPLLILGAVSFNPTPGLFVIMCMNPSS